MTLSRPLRVKAETGLKPGPRSLYLTHSFGAASFLSTVTSLQGYLGELLGKCAQKAHGWAQSRKSDWKYLQGGQESFS